MIVRSSNLAGNLILQRIGPAAVTDTCRALGARDTQVLRCFEDRDAFAAGVNNVTTAADLCAIFTAIGEARAPNSASALRLLERQQLRSGIPRGLPPGVRVANKTGSIERHFHDAALVLPEGRPPYALAVMTRSFPSKEDAEAAVAALSVEAWKHLAQ
jgi:beta-lactamase class A